VGNNHAVFVTMTVSQRGIRWIIFETVITKQANQANQQLKGQGSHSSQIYKAPLGEKALGKLLEAVYRKLHGSTPTVLETFTKKCMTEVRLRDGGKRERT